MDLLTNINDETAPDSVNEVLHSNLIHIPEIPKKIWSAPTNFRYSKDIFNLYRDEGIVPPHIFHDKRLYSFCNLSITPNPFSGLIEEYDIYSEDSKIWIEDDNKSKLLVQLLNDCIRVLCYSYNLSFNKRGKKYYYRKGVLEDSTFKAFSKGSGKQMILDYSNSFGFAHRTISIKILRMNSEFYLWIETGWYFTKNGYQALDRSRQSIINTRFLSTQKNISNLNEIRYWLWFLSKDGENIDLFLGDETLKIPLQLKSINMNFGIFEDRIKLSKVKEPYDIKFDTEGFDFDQNEDEDGEEDESYFF